VGTNDIQNAGMNLRLLVPAKQSARLANRHDAGRRPPTPLFLREATGSALRASDGK
jgi:hypothetical protein